MRAAPVLLLFASPALAQGLGHVWTVDDDGPADFATIQEAVDAAQLFDRIAVRAGVYAGFSILEKSLALEAAGGAHVEVRGPIEVRELDGSAWVFLKGLRTSEALLPAGEVATFGAYSSTGPIWVEDCSFGAPRGELALLSDFHGDAATVQGANVIFVHVDLRGGSGAGGAPGGTGLALKNSNTWVHAARMRGGHGLALGGPPSAGGAAIAEEGGFLFVAGSELRGGDGAGALDPAACDDGGDGGPGIVLSGLLPALETHDNAQVGGAGGAAVCGQAGADGQPLLVLGPAGVIAHPGAAVGVEVQSLAAYDAPQTFTVTGAPGDAVLLGCSFFSDANAPGTTGWLLLMDPVVPLGRALLPASGTITVSRPLPPEIFPLGESVTVYVQPVALREGGAVVYGAPAAFGLIRPPAGG